MSRWRARAGVAAAALVALAVGWLWAGATRDGWLLSDDFLLNALRGAGDDGMAVAWGEVFADFARPWLGISEGFYRPLLSVSFATDLARSSGHPARALHEQSLALHAVTIVAAAWLAALHAPGRRTLGALLGGLLVAAHPVGVEPAAWIAARNSGLEVAVSTTALLAFALALRSRRRAPWIATAVLAALALSAKESAVMLPVSMLALDLLHRPRRRLAARLSIHLAFAPLWLGYAALRIGLFGSFAGSGGVAAPPSPPEMAAAFAAKLGALLLPVTHTDPGRAAAAGGLAWITLAAWAALLVAARRRAWVLAGGAVWLALHMAPTFALRLSPGLGGSRMIWGAVPPLAVVVTAALLGGRRARVHPVPVLAGLAAVVAVWVGAARVGVAAYTEAWRDMRDAERELAATLAAGPGTTADRPIGLAAMPEAPRGAPPCNPNLWFAIFERPAPIGDVPLRSLGFVTIADVPGSVERPAPIGDVPLRSLGFVTIADVPGSEHLYHDAGPVRAMLENGAPVATWRGELRRFTLREPLPTDDALPPLTPADPGTWRFAAPLRADRIASVELNVDGVEPDAVRGRIEWLCDVPDLPPGLAGIDFAGGTSVDITHAMGPASLATVGVPIHGLRVTLDTAGPTATAALRDVAVLPRLPQLPIPDLGGRDVDLDALERALGAMPPPPPGVAADRGRLLILTPHTAFTQDLAPGEPVRLAAATRHHLDAVRTMTRQPDIHVWFEYAPGDGHPAGARSAWTRARLVAPQR